MNNRDELQELLDGLRSLPPHITYNQSVIISLIERMIAARPRN